MKTVAVIVAAGASERMGGDTPKILMPIGGQTVIRRALLAFEAAAEIDAVVLVCRGEERAALEKETEGLKKFAAFAPGGGDRQASVKNGVLAAGECDFVAIHDGARPLVTPAEIDNVCRDARKYGCATLAVKVKDTIKLGDADGFVAQTPDRALLYQIQTPQVFALGAYLGALALAERRGRCYTDDCQLIENAGGRVYLSAGAYTNLKLTTPEDLRVAAAITGGSAMRIGHGYDVHRLAPNRKLIVGGVEIPFEKGLLGHSDADVLLHAVSDALLGAAGLGDIGGMFPDTDPAFKGADSLMLLKRVVAAVAEKGCRASNIDCTVLAQRPKLKPYTAQMRQNIALACGLSPEQVNIKATTEEGLGFTGRQEGIAAHCVCLVQKG